MLERFKRAGVVLKLLSASLLIPTAASAEVISSPDAGPRFEVLPFCRQVERLYPADLFKGGSAESIIYIHFKDPAGVNNRLRTLSIQREGFDESLNGPYRSFADSPTSIQVGIIIGLSPEFSRNIRVAIYDPEAESKDPLVSKTVEAPSCN